MLRGRSNRTHVAPLCGVHAMPLALLEVLHQAGIRERASQYLV